MPTLYLYSDNIAESSWKKRTDLPHLPPHMGPEDMDLLEQALSHYFHSKEGRGRNCKVEVYRRRVKKYFLAKAPGWMRQRRGCQTPRRA